MVPIGVASRIIITFSTTVQAIIYVNPWPLVNMTLSSNPICKNQTTTLSGIGASTYTWSGGITNGITFNATISNIYTVTGTDANGCTNTSTASLSVYPLPNIIATANPSSIC